MWITLQPADLKARLSQAELAALQRASGDYDETGMEAVLAQVTGLVRGYVAANARNRMDGAGTIPATLKGAALDLACVDYSTRAGGFLSDPKDLRRNARDAAIRLLQDVAADRFRVDQPDADAEEQAESQAAHAGPAINDPESIL